jgi:hypothetical protein
MLTVSEILLGLEVRGASEQKLQFSKPLQNSQFLQGLGRHRFGWAFLVAKVSRKSPNFCNKFCNDKKVITPCDHGVRPVLSYHPSSKCSFCSVVDTVGESFEPNIDTAQKAGTLTGPAKPMNLAQRSMPRKANLSHCRAAWAGSNVPVCSASIRLK